MKFSLIFLSVVSIILFQSFHSLFPSIFPFLYSYLGHCFCIKIFLHRLYCMGSRHARVMIRNVIFKIKYDNCWKSITYLLLTVFSNFFLIMYSIIRISQLAIYLEWRKQCNPCLPGNYNRLGKSHKVLHCIFFLMCY